MYVAYINSLAADHCDAGCQEHADGVVSRFCRRLVGLWLRNVERRTEASLRQLDHGALLEDYQMSRRG
jgi:hypothetical protein